MKRALFAILAVGAVGVAGCNDIAGPGPTCVWVKDTTTSVTRLIWNGTDTTETSISIIVPRKSCPGLELRRAGEPRR